MADCKEGKKPETAQVKSDVKALLEWVRKKRIAMAKRQASLSAMSGEDVYTPEGEAVNLLSMMRRFEMQG